MRPGTRSRFARARQKPRLAHNAWRSSSVSVLFMPFTSIGAAAVAGRCCAGPLRERRPPCRPDIDIVDIRSSTSEPSATTRSPRPLRGATRDRRSMHAIGLERLDNGLAATKAKPLDRPARARPSSAARTADGASIGAPGMARCHPCRPADPVQARDQVRNGSGHPLPNQRHHRMRALCRFQWMQRQGQAPSGFNG
jgi:hypothetical protein